MENKKLKNKIYKVIKIIWDNFLVLNKCWDKVGINKRKWNKRIITIKNNKTSVMASLKKLKSRINNIIQRIKNKDS
jgi:hypothetical protein